jgi:hypothetical protein
MHSIDAVYQPCNSHHVVANIPMSAPGCWGRALMREDEALDAAIPAQKTVQQERRQLPSCDGLHRCSRANNGLLASNDSVPNQCKHEKNIEIRMGFRVQSMTQCARLRPSPATSTI